jgi:hypothetical protein
LDFAAFFLVFWIKRISATSVVLSVKQQKEMCDARQNATLDSGSCSSKRGRSGMAGHRSTRCLLLSLRFGIVDGKTVLGCAYGVAPARLSIRPHSSDSPKFRSRLSSIRNQRSRLARG